MTKSQKQEFMNKLLGDELIAHLQYAIASKEVIGADYDSCNSEFKEHSDDELKHFYILLDLMVQRNYSINSDLLSLIRESKSGYTYMIGTVSKVLTKFQYDSEVKAINAYSEFLDLLMKEEKKDYTMIQEIKKILNDEIEHKTDLDKLYSSITDGDRLSV